MFSAARATALERRPEVRLAANRVPSGRSGHQEREKQHYIPDIAIQASLLQFRQNINFLPQNIGFRWRPCLPGQPWDWGEKRHKVRQAALAGQQAELSLEDTREQILLDVNSKFRHLREARSHLAVAEAFRDAETEKMRNPKGSIFPASDPAQRLAKGNSLRWQDAEGPIPSSGSRLLERRALTSRNRWVRSRAVKPFHDPASTDLTRH